MLSNISIMAIPSCTSNTPQNDTSNQLFYCLFLFTYVYIRAYDYVCIHIDIVIYIYVHIEHRRIYGNIYRQIDKHLKMHWVPARCSEDVGDVRGYGDGCPLGRAAYEHPPM